MARPRRAHDVNLPCDRSSRRRFFGSAVGAAAVAMSANQYSLLFAQSAGEPSSRDEPNCGLDISGGHSTGKEAVGKREKFRIPKLETILVQPRWLFLKVHTDVGIVGLGEPIVEGRAKTCA
jgi:hypothetical protein